MSLGKAHGYRNAQVTVLAPTGTIAFMMDCDTTGVEPDIALVKYKRLVGGGTMRIVNRSVPEALRRLGYGEAETAEMLAYLERNGIPGRRAPYPRTPTCPFSIAPSRPRAASAPSRPWATCA